MPARIASFATLLLALLASPIAMAIEEPRYQVIEQDGAFELRDYAAYLVAETRVEASFTEAGSEAFRRLFRYISGNNAAQQKIAMTAPVTQVADADGYRVAFVVPSRYSASTVPEPLDPRIEIRAVPARRVAVWRYSGRWTQERYDQMERQLREAIAARGLSVDGPPVLARYDPPFMPWFMRRNEVLIPTAAPHPMRAAAGKG